MEVTSTYKKDPRIGKEVTVSEGGYTLKMKLRGVHKDGDIYDAMFRGRFDGDLLGNVSLNTGAKKVKLGNLLLVANFNRVDLTIKVLCAKVEVTGYDVDRGIVRKLYLKAFETLAKRD